MASTTARCNRSNVRRVLVATVSEDEWRRLNPRVYVLNRVTPKGTTVQAMISDSPKRWDVFLIKRYSFPGFNHSGTFDTWDEAAAMAKLFLSQEE